MITQLYKEGYNIIILIIVITNTITSRQRRRQVLIKGAWCSYSCTVGATTYAHTSVSGSCAAIGIRRTIGHSLTLSLTHILSLSLSLSLIHTHKLTNALTHTGKHTHTYTHEHTHTHTRTHELSIPDAPCEGADHPRTV